MAIPTLVQSVHTSLDLVGGYGGGPNSTFKIPLPNLSLANNLLALGVQYSSALTIVSVTDDKGNTWGNFSATTDGTNSTKYDIWYVPGAAEGTQVVTIAWSAVGAFLSATLVEFYNVATSTPTDLGSATSNDTASPYAAGSFTTTTDGDLVLCFGFGQGAGAGTLTGIVADGGFTLIGADIYAAGLNQGTMAQYLVQSTAGAINPAFHTTGNTTGAYDICAVAFKAATAGTAPTSVPRIVAVQHQYIGVSVPPAPLQFPCPAGGNLLVGLWNTNDQTITALTDSASNSWQFPAGASVNTGTEATQVIYAAAATTGPTLGTLALTFSGVPSGDAFLVWYSVVGAATVPFDVGATGSGTQSVDAPLSAVTITPSTTGGIVFANISIVRRTMSGVTVSGQVATFDSVFNAGLDNVVGGSSNSQLEEDAGNAHVYNTATSALSFVWTYTDLVGPPGTGGWASAAAAFKGPPPPTFTPIRRGHRLRRRFTAQVD